MITFVLVAAMTSNQSWKKLEKFEEFGDRFRGLTLVVALAFVIVMEFEAINAWVNNWLDSL